MPFLSSSAYPPPPPPPRQRAHDKQEPTSESAFEHLEQAPDDPIIGVTTAFKKDPSPVKLNVGVGAYRCEEGKPYIPRVVREAEQRLVNDTLRNKEYLPIIGNPTFNQLSAKLVFGEDSRAVKERRVCTAQCLSGTGSLRVGTEFLAKHYAHKTVYIPVPTWGNHATVFSVGGLKVKHYRYYHPQTRGLDYEGLLQDLKSAPSGVVALLHACAHNPTGVDPTAEQWREIHKVIRGKGMLPFFDCAYQGFASGNLDTDAYAVRLFANDGGECFVAQSYAKNMGLYGERVGALSMVCASESVAMRVESQVKLIIRPLYSSPPIHGAAIAATILGDRDLFDDWKADLKSMADRIFHMRQLLFEALKAQGTPGDWSHVINQIGMFTFTGLTKEQVAFITEKFRIYITFDGRISMAGLSIKTVPYLAKAIHAAVTTILE